MAKVKAIIVVRSMFISIIKLRKLQSRTNKIFYKRVMIVECVSLTGGSACVMAAIVVPMYFSHVLGSFLHFDPKSSQDTGGQQRKFRPMKKSI